MLTQAPKGTRDMLPDQAYLWQGLEQKMRALAALWGYREIRTPVFEHTELFLRGVGDTTDIVNKEMYTFKDKGDRSITLKPEGTAGAVRAFIENHLFSETLPCKVYYLAAPIFRYENPQAGRLREHHQFGMECFGGKSPAVEAELISTLFGFLTGLGLKNLKVHINSIGCPKCRPVYHQKLKEYLGQFVAALDAGQSYSFWLYSGYGNHQFGGGACFVETSLPSMLYLYNTTCYDLGTMEYGDPSMVWIPPVEQKINEITFCTFNHNKAPIDYHYVNIVVETSSVNEVYLDGTLISPDRFDPLIGNGAYSFARVQISHGVHHLSCIWGLIAHVYGFGTVKGYAYCVGANVLDLSGSLFVNGQSSNLYHNGLYLCVGESADFMLRTNYPVRRVFWVFDGVMTEGGMTATHDFEQVGDFVTKAFVEGIDAFTYEPVYDTMTIDVHVGEPEYHLNDTMVCDVDAFDYYGVAYS